MCAKQQIIRILVFVFQVKFMRCILANTRCINIWEYQPIKSQRRIHHVLWTERNLCVCICYIYSWSDFPHLFPPSTFSSHYSLFVHSILHHTALHHVCHLKLVFTPYSTSIIFPKHVETCNIPRSVTLTSSFWNNTHTKKNKYALSQVWVVRTHLQNVCFENAPEGQNTRTEKPK